MKKIPFHILLLFFLSFLFIGGVACSTQKPVKERLTANSLLLEPDLVARPVKWAEPIEGLPGLYNFYKVDDNLYRSAQPLDEGFAELKKLGVKTVITLRTLHTDSVQCEKMALYCFQIQVEVWDPDEEEVIEFLRAAINPSMHPLLLHCKRGADRTGMMVAMYRIVVQGWSKEEALREMVLGGYGYNPFWEDVFNYVLDVDVEEIKRKLKGD